MNHWLEALADEIVATLFIGATIFVVIFQTVSGNPIELPEWYIALVSMIVAFYFGQRV